MLTLPRPPPGLYLHRTQVPFVATTHRVFGGIDVRYRLEVGIPQILEEVNGFHHLHLFAYPGGQPSSCRPRPMEVEVPAWSVSRVGVCRSREPQNQLETRVVRVIKIKVDRVERGLSNTHDPSSHPPRSAAVIAGLSCPLPIQPRSGACVWCLAWQAPCQDSLLFAWNGCVGAHVIHPGRRQQPSSANVGVYLPYAHAPLLGPLRTRLYFHLHVGTTRILVYMHDHPPLFLLTSTRSPIGPRHIGA